jgi:hypothetical protein
VKPTNTANKITIYLFKARKLHLEGVWESRCAFNSMNYTLQNDEEIHDTKAFLESKRSIARKLIKRELKLE